MRRKGLWLSVLATTLIAGNVSAATIVNDGYWGDWFLVDPSAAQVANGDWNSANFTVDPTVGFQIDDPNTDANGPGAGGQPYDAEMLLWYAEAGTLHIGLITGFSPLGESGAPGGGTTQGSFQAGDLFLNIGNSGAYEMAVGLSVTDDRDGRYWFNQTGLTTESVYYNDNPTSEPDYRASDPYRVVTTGPSIPTGSPDEVISSPVTFNYSQPAYGSGASRRYFYEISIDLGLNDFSQSAVGLHWTMECGNDNINAVIPSGSIPFDPPPVVPVPAAAPLGLLGMGLLGLVRRLRRRPAC